MSISTVLTVAGIGLTVVFGSLALYFVLRQLNPGRITFIKEQSIGLFDRIVRNLPELNVLYNDSPVGQNLVLVEGSLLNTGAIDITPSMVETPITITLPEGYRWLIAKIVSASNNVKASVKLKEWRNLSIVTGLFRREEYIRFQALAELPMYDDKAEKNTQATMGTRLEKALKFTHRIANTRQVDKRSVEETAHIAKRRSTVPILLLLAAAAVALLVYSHFTGLPGELVYSCEVEKGRVLQVKMKPRADGSVKVKAIDQEYVEILQLNDFFSKCRGKPSVVEDKGFKLYFFLRIAIYIAFPLGYAFFVYRKYRQIRKLRKILVLDT